MAPALRNSHAWRRGSGGFRGLVLNGRSGRLLGKRGADGHGARLQRLGHFADQLDMEQAVDQGRIGDAEMLGELKAALEGAAGDAPVQVGLRGLFLLRIAGDGQGLAFHADFEVAFGEAGDGHRDAVGVIGQLLEIVGRIAKAWSSTRDAPSTRRARWSKPTVERNRGVRSRVRIATFSYEQCFRSVMQEEPFGPLPCGPAPEWRPDSYDLIRAAEPSSAPRALT